MTSPPAATLDDKAPAGRREAAKSANRQAILDAARAVFAELGYEAATVRDIIRRTGLSVGAFYNYYRSKEEVYGALADDGARRFGPRLRAVQGAASDFEGWMREAATAYFIFVAEEHASWQARRPPGERHGPALRAETPEILAVIEEVRAAIFAAVAAGGAPPVDADYLAAALIGLVREVADRMVERRPPDPKGAAAFALALIAGGLPALPRRSDA